MPGTPLFMFLGLSLFMFCVGIVGVVVRRNPIVIFMCIELMLNAANLAFLAFARYRPTLALTGADLPTQQASSMAGQMVVLFVMAVAATEVAVGLGIIMAVYRLRDRIDVDDLNLLKG